MDAKVHIKQYEFQNGVKVVMKKSSWGLDKKVMKLLTSLDVKGFEDFNSIKFKSLIELIVDSELIEKLFDTVLVPIPEDAKPDWSELETSEVLGVLEDFFTLNPSLVKLLGIGKLEAVTQLGLNSEKKDSI